MKSFKDLKSSPVIRQIIVALGPFVINGVLGMSEGYSAILLPQLQHENSTIKVDTQLAAWMASMAALPMAGGCLAGGYLMEKIGRRGIHIWSCVPLIVGWFLIAGASNSTVILVGRFLTGISDGLLGPASGVYIAEISQPDMRGVLIISTAVAVTFGLFLSHLLGTFLTWRLTAFISGIISIPFAIFMFFVPESPTYLLKLRKIDEAKKAFYWCRGHSKEAEKELEELIKRQKEQDDSPKKTFCEQMRSFAKPEFWKPTVIISVLFFTAQITGTQAIASYSIQIIQECGLSGDVFDEYFAMITMDLFRITSSIISSILVNKMNRRSLVMFSGYGVALVLFLLCSYLWIAPRISLNSPTMILVFLTAYVFLMVIGLIPLSWTVMGELFPVAYRGLGTAITSLACYFVFYFVIQTFPYLLEYFGNISGVFIFYASATLSGTIFLTFFLPETKDKPLYVIEDFFKAKKYRRSESNDSNVTREC